MDCTIACREGQQCDELRTADSIVHKLQNAEGGRRSRPSYLFDVPVKAIVRQVGLGPGEPASEDLALPHVEIVLEVALLPLRPPPQQTSQERLQRSIWGSAMVCTTVTRSSGGRHKRLGTRSESKRTEAAGARTLVSQWNWSAMSPQKPSGSSTLRLYISSYCSRLLTWHPSRRSAGGVKDGTAACLCGRPPGMITPPRCGAPTLEGTPRPTWMHSPLLERQYIWGLTARQGLSGFIYLLQCHANANRAA